MVQKTDTLILNLAFTCTLFLASWFNLNFFSAVYWFLCLLFIYFVCTEDERHIFNNPRIKYMILTIVGYSFLIVLIHIALSVHFSLTKNTSTFNESLKILGFNKITSDDFNWKNGLSVLFSILNFLIGLLYYYNYVTRSKEIGYQKEFIEAEISDEDEKRDYNLTLKRQMLKRSMYLNNLAEFFLIAILAFNDGIIILPYIFIFFLLCIGFLIQMQEISYFKLWKFLIWPVKIWTFGLLYIQFFFRITYITEKLPDYVVIVFGYIFKFQSLSYYGLVPMVLLFIINCLQRSLVDFINEKSWVLRDEDFYFNSHDKKHQNWLEKVYMAFQGIFSSFSLRVYQMIAILWSMLHPSIVMTLILVLSVWGLFMQKSTFQRVFLKPLHIISTIYIFLQIVFNITYFFDYLAESQELFLVGIYKYCLFENNSLQGTLSEVLKYDMVTSRALNLGIDLIIYLILTRIYFLNKSHTQLILRALISSSPFFKLKKETKKDFLIEQHIVEKDSRLEKSSFLDISTVRVPKVKPFRERIMNFLRKIYEGLMLHTSKFILVMLFFAAMITIDGIHLGYFILFLLFSILNQGLAEKIWKLQMVYTMIVLISLYIYQVLSGYFKSLVLENSHVLSEYIGVKRYKFWLFLGYKEHLLLLVTLFVQNIVFESQKYKELSKKYFDDNRENKNKIDIFSKFFLKFGLLLCYLSLLIVGFLETPSFLTLIYLIIVAMIIIIELTSNNEKKSLKTLNRIWPIFILLNFFILTVRYLFQINFFSLLLETYKIEKIISFKDIGLDKDPMRISLITDAIVLILINTQRKVFADEKYLEILKTMELKSRHSLFQTPYGSLSYYYYCFLIYVKQFIYTHISKLLLFIVFLLIINSKTCIGLFYLAFLILILIIEKQNRWSASWIPIYFYSLVVIFAQYLLQMQVSKNFMQDLMIWGGFSYESDKITTIFLQNCSIQILCILQRKSQRWRKFIVSEKDFGEFYEKFRHIIADFKNIRKNVQKIRYKTLEQSQISLFSPEEMREETEDHEPLLSRIVENIPEEADSNELFKNFQIFIIQKPIMDGSWFLVRLDHAYQKIGFELALLLLVAAAFYKLNVISILYIVLAAYFSFHCKYMTLEDQFSEKKVRALLKKWRLVYFLISLGLLFQYAILLWFPLNWNVFYPWKDVMFLCDESSKNAFSKLTDFHDESDLIKCLNNWKKWLFLEKFKDNELFIDFFLLFMMVLYEDFFFKNKEDQAIIHKPGDENDFTMKRKHWVDSLKFYYYCYFYKFALIIFFFIGAIDNLSGSSDLISGIYLITSMYLHYNSSKLTQEKNRIWKKVEAFNNIVMIIYILYQAPVFPCPIVQEDRYYFSAEECLTVQSIQKSFFFWKHKEDSSPEKWLVMYALFSQTIGLNKICNTTLNFFIKPICIVIFFFMGLLQRQIFNSAIYSSYVAAYLKRESQESVRRAVRYIENNHLKRIWNYENLRTQKEVYISLQKRVDYKIKQWEDLLALKTLEPQVKIKPLSTESKEISEKKEVFDQLDQYSEEMRIKAEKICNKEFPAITLTEVLEILKKAEGDEKRVEIDIKLKKFEKKKAKIMEIYASKSINLIRHWPQRLDILTAEEESLKKHLEALEEELKKASKDKEENIIKDVKKESSPLSSAVLKEKPWYQKIFKETKSLFNEISLSMKKLLLSMTHTTFFSEPNKKLIDDPLIFIIVYFIISQMDKICYLLMIINHIVNDNLLSLVFPLTLFLYALLENPIPLKGYWKFIIFYTITIIIIKYLYQLPIFCGSPPFTLFFYTGEAACISRGFNEVDLISRIDYIIGIHKFSGNASYPKNQGFFVGVICDYLVLIFLLFYRFLMEKLGFWQHIKIEKSLFEIPQFHQKDHSADKFSRKKHQDLEDNAQDRYALRMADLLEIRQEVLEKEKLGVLDRIFKGIKDFGLRVMPNYLPGQHEIELIHGENHEKKMVPTHCTLIKPGKDYYSPAFAVCLLILAYFILFYQKMVGKKESISETLDNNSQFSGDLVLAILLILAWIIFDRVIYNLKKSSNKSAAINKNNNNSNDSNNNNIISKIEDDGKLAIVYKIFIHIMIFVLVHYYLCFGLPIGARTFFCNSPYLVICYLFFTWYLYYSAYQIKFGYPENDTSQIFTTSTDVFTRLAFKVYRAIPFLTELKAILDWTVIKTSLDLFQWIKLDDAYANLYLCKAEMAVRKENKPGTARNFWEKCSNGCCLVILLLLIIIGPILLFSTLNPILETNNVHSGAVTLELFLTQKQGSNATSHINSEVFEIFRVENLEINSLDTNVFKKLRQSFEGIESDSQNRVQTVTILPYSEKKWDISRPRLQDLQELLAEEKTHVFLTAKWNFLRTHPPGNEVSRGSNTILLGEKAKKEIRNGLAGNSSKEVSIDLLNIFPMFLSLGQSSYASVKELQVTSNQNMNFPSHTSCTLVFNDGEGSMYWGIKSQKDSGFMKAGFFDENKQKVSIVLLNDFVFGSLFGASISNISVIGLYATFVFAIGKFIRLIFDRISQRVIYEEMPNTDDLMDLCESIYIARAEGDLYNEQRLYELLIRIYRSPEILIKLTGTGIESKEL